MPTIGDQEALLAEADLDHQRGALLGSPLMSPVGPERVAERDQHNAPASTAATTASIIADAWPRASQGPQSGGAGGPVVIARHRPDEQVTAQLAHVTFAVRGANFGWENP